MSAAKGGAPGGDSRGTDGLAATRPSSRVTIPDNSPTLRYLRQRESVLGHRVWVPLFEPEAGAERLAEALGSRAAARAWLWDALEELTPL